MFVRTQKFFKFFFFLSQSEEFEQTEARINAALLIHTQTLNWDVCGGEVGEYGFISALFWCRHLTRKITTDLILTPIFRCSEDQINGYKNMSELMLGNNLLKRIDISFWLKFLHVLQNLWNYFKKLIFIILKSWSLLYASYSEWLILYLVSELPRYQWASTQSQKLKWMGYRTMCSDNSLMF